MLADEQPNLKAIWQAWRSYKEKNVHSNACYILKIVQHIIILKKKYGDSSKSRLIQIHFSR